MDSVDEEELRKIKALRNESKASKDDRVEFLYKSKTDPEDYLLGKRVDSNFERENIKTKKESEVGALFDEDVLVHNEKVNTQIKEREDPLTAIRRKEEDARKALLNNPVKMKHLEKALKEKEKGDKRKRRDSSGDELLARYFAMKGVSVKDSRKHKKVKLPDDDKSLLQRYLELIGKARRKVFYSDTSDDEFETMPKQASNFEQTDKSKCTPSPTCDDSTGNRREMHTERESESKNRLDQRSSKARVDHSEDKHNDRNSSHHRTRRDSRSSERHNRNNDRRRLSDSKKALKENEENKEYRRNGSHHRTRQVSRSPERLNRSTERKRGSDSNHSSNDGRKYGRRCSLERIRRVSRSPERGSRPTDRKNRSHSSNSSEEERNDSKRRDRKQADKKRKRSSSSESSSSSSGSQSGSSSSGSEDTSPKKHSMGKHSRGSSKEQSEERIKKERPSYGLIHPKGETMLEAKARSDAERASRSDKLKTSSSSETNEKPTASANTSKTRMTESEKKEKLKEMMDNAQWREEQRMKNVKQYDEEQKREDEEFTKNAEKYDKFIAPIMTKHAAESSVEEQLRRNRHKIQRNPAATEQNFARK